ncbi:MAG: hypothetical protein AB7U82_27820 [Blastocatellales bacterium]
MANTNLKGLQPVKLTTEEDGTVKAWYRIADLILDDNNAREHGDRDLDATADSIEQFEQQKPIVVDANGIVRAGNGTCMALLRRGEELVWATRSRLCGEKAVAYALADNRTAELSKWDYQIVAESLKWLEEQGQDISKLGWAEYEIEPLLQAHLRPRIGWLGTTVSAKGSMATPGGSQSNSLAISWKREGRRRG